jgi:hypothetical protein
MNLGGAPAGRGSAADIGGGLLDCGDDAVRAPGAPLRAARAAAGPYHRAMVIFVLAMAGVVAALWARTCFVTASRTEGEARRRWRIHGAFYAAGACTCVGLALLARVPGFGLAALAGAVALVVWGVRMKSAAASGRG